MSKYQKTTGVFNITYSCNDHCDFCFNLKDINVSPFLSLDKIRDNYFYLQRKYGLDHVIISGGEPSLHPHFWEVMDFFYNQVDQDISVALNTNSLPYQDDKKRDDLCDFLMRCSLPKKQLSLSLSTVRSVDRPSRYDQNKLAGVAATIKAGLDSETRSLIVLAITKQNYKALPDLAQFLVNELAQFSEKKQLNVQLRGLFIDSLCMTENQIQKTLPESFSHIYPFLIECINILKSCSQINLKLFNIPLCLIQQDVDIEYFKTKKKRIYMERRYEVDFKNQFSHVEPYIYHESVYDVDDCKKCILNTVCNGIQKEFLDRKYIKKLEPIEV